MEDIDSDASRFRVAKWHVDPSTNRLSQGGSEIKLEPKVMAVLVYLARRPGQNVTRTELEAAVWTGSVVSYDAVTGAIQKLRKVFDDDPAHPRVIETLSKKGYRLIAPVSPLEASTSTAGLKPAEGQTLSNHRWRRSVPIAGLAVLLVALAVAVVWIQQRPAEDAAPAGDAETKSIAVLPFQNLTGDPGQDYFAEGMSDDLIASLARFSSLQVIARDSSFFYRDPALPIRELADRLNARYLLRGSVRRAETHVRISVQLIDAQLGRILWAERFDDEANRLFELQDEVTHKVVTALAGRINVADRQELGRPRTKNLQAYDYFLYGRQRFFLYASAEENRKARESFRRAIALDPEFALAYAMLAWTHAFDAMNGWSEFRQAALERARELASKAIALDEAMPVAYFVRGLAYRELGDRVHALVEAERAIEFDPNYAGAHVLLATLLYFNERPQEGMELMQRAIALNPNHPYNYSFHLGQAYYILRRYDEAIEALNQVLASNPAAERAHLWLAAAYAQAGRRDEAQWELDQVLATNPDFSLERIRHAYPFTNPADLEHFLGGLRRGGLSE